MRSILISADGGLRWADVAMDASRRDYQVMVMDRKADFCVNASALPSEPVYVQRRTYERVVSGDGFDVWRETLR